MTFVLNMALRELRASWRRLLLFFVCIAIGVASMVSVRSFIEILADTVARQARALNGADVRAETMRPWPPDALDLLNRFTSAPGAVDYTDVVDTRTMVRAADAAAMRPTAMDLRGVKPNYPLYGDVRLVAGGVYSPAMLANQGVIVTRSLLGRLGLAVGDRLAIGSRAYVIRGVAERFPGNGLNFNPGPRALIAYDEIESGGLTAFGSRVRYSRWYKTIPDQDDKFVQDLGQEFRRRQIKVGVGLSTTRWIRNWLNQGLSNMQGFIGLVSLSILVLGGIGVASVTRVFIQHRLRTIAILKCIGGRNPPVIGAYLTQSIGLGLAGALFGLALAYLVTVVGTRYGASRLPLDVKPGLTWHASIEGVGVGLMITLLFAVPPLLDIRNIKPNLLLRRDALPARLDWVQLISKMVVVAILIAFAMWQAGSYRRAWLFISAIAATAIVLNLAGSAVIRLLRQVRRLRSFPLRYGVGGLSRPGNQTKVVLFAVGIGTLFIVTVRIHQANVLAGYHLDMTALEADMFLVDVQPDQRAVVEATVQTFGGRQLKLIPLVRARLTAINRVVDRTTRESAAAAKGQIGGQFQVSYGSTLVDRETVVAGTLWPPTPSSEPEISVDENYARWIGLDVGDRLTFDVLGRRIDARITSIRQIHGGARAIAWRMRSDIVFRPGVLEQAPHMFVGAVKGPASPAERARLQNALVDALPNVTMIDAMDDITEVRNRVAEATTIITAVGGFVSLCGVMILIGSIAITKVQRIYDAAVLKTLGAKRRVLMKIAAVEYSVLGLLAGIIGSGAAILVTRAQHAFDRLDFAWQPRPFIKIGAVALTVLLVTIVGIAASWEVFARKPLAIMREE